MRLTIGVLACLLVADGAAEKDRPIVTAPPPLGEWAVPDDQRCRVEVRFWEIKKGLYHAYILTSDSDGTTDFRAGPASPGPLLERIWAFLKPGSPRAERWGPLRAEYGPYVPGTIDYDAGTPPTMTLLDDGRSCGVYNLRLSGAVIAINSAKLPYNPMTTNCNAFVRYALARIHVTPGPPPVAAPGWYTTLRPERAD